MKRSRFEPHDSRESRAMSADGVVSVNDTPLQYRELHLSSQDNLVDFGSINLRAPSSSFSKTIVEQLLLEEFVIKNVTVPYSWFDVSSEQTLSLTFTGTNPSIPAAPANTIVVRVPAGSYPFTGNSDTFDANGFALITDRYSNRGLCGILNRQLLFNAGAAAGLFGTNANDDHGHFFLDSKTNRITLAFYPQGGTILVTIADSPFARYLGFSPAQLGTPLTLQQFTWYPHSVGPNYYSGIQAAFTFESCPYSRVLVRCPQLSNAILSRGTNNGHHIQGIVAELPVNQTFGDMLVKESNLMSEQKFVTHGAKLNSLSFDLLFNDGSNVNLNGQPWSITIGIWFRRNMYSDHF